ncbi:actin cortical patch SUR7/pH-response regulator pali [Cantharellus anzutake]|uniref:actin cortical patch SUR7/pH-response regulator pali n=1 Tax=Cantharellus anzutake TaxID=1750568 RepID=UPI00190873C0|nr:actin cortical patch SUR7/pH-response regulator pali [Cantharellus anzutake]KAF8335976.1 actin cortical patch SUR7/pH-response regulator pali [Cantharellus anzutake]
MTSGFHVGTFFLFVSFVLLVFVSVSAPVWHTLGFMKVSGLAGHSSGARLVLGVYGYCITAAGSDSCSKVSVGYPIGDVLNSIGGTTAHRLHNLTGALILHPIAAGITFIALLTALGAHTVGFLCASFIALIAWIATVLALILDFVMFGIVKRHVNDVGLSSLKASWSTGIWLVVAAVVTLFIGTITACCGCLTDRRKNRRSY